MYYCLRYINLRLTFGESHKTITESFAISPAANYDLPSMQSKFNQKTHPSEHMSAVH